MNGVWWFSSRGNELVVVVLVEGRCPFLLAPLLILSLTYTPSVLREMTRCRIEIKRIRRLVTCCLFLEWNRERACRSVCGKPHRTKCLNWLRARQLPPNDAKTQIGKPFLCCSFSIFNGDHRTTRHPPFFISMHYYSCSRFQQHVHGNMRFLMDEKSILSSICAF